MLYHVPSRSKSSTSGLATGFAARNALRSAISDHVPSELTRMTPFGTVGTPCEQPAPASRAYSLSPMKATLETPLTRLAIARLVWLEGRASTTVVTTLSLLTFETRPPSIGSFVLPVYGP